MGVHPEVFLAAGYAVFLLGVALGLDLLARHSHARSERYRTAGFAYHPTHDAWICPEDQILMRTEIDHERRLIRYRGPPQICNHCPARLQRGLAYGLQKEQRGASSASQLGDARRTGSDRETVRRVVPEPLCTDAGFSIQEVS